MDLNNCVPELLAYNMAKAYSDSKGGYVETKRETAIEPFIVPAGEKSVTKLTPHQDCIVDGAKYVVTIGGESYKVVASTDEQWGFQLGNLGLSNSSYEDTGENFSIIVRKRAESSVTNRIALRDTVSEDTTVTVELITETIHPIDPKYLPNMGSGGGLPVVEIVSSGVPGLVSEEVNALLHEYAEQGTPIVAKLVADGMGNVASSVLNYLKQGSYLTFTGDSMFGLSTNDDGAWELLFS